MSEKLSPAQAAFLDNRNTANGQFQSTARQESTNVSLETHAPRAWPRRNEEVLTSPLTVTEIGQRRDESGQVGGFMALGPEDMNASDEETADRVSEKLLGSFSRGGFDMSITPFSVKDGKVICKVSCDASEIEADLEDDELTALQWGAGERARRAQYMSPRSEREDLYKMVDTSGFAFTDGVTQAVPPLPLGIGSTEMVLGENKYSSDCSARLEFEGGSFEYTPGYGDYDEPVEEGIYPADMAQETREEIEAHVEAVAINYLEIRKTAIRRIAEQDGFAERALELAVAGLEED